MNKLDLIKKIYEFFLNRMNILKTKQLYIIKKSIKELEREKEQEIRKKFK